MTDGGLPRPRILLVEDEGGVALLVEDMLEELGCEVAASVARLPSAFAAVEAVPFDFALLDVNLRGEPSFELARLLRERGIPFAFSTGYGNGGVPDEFQDLPVLTKPFGIPDLRAVLAGALGADRGA